jgi:hypothetical protein
MVAAMAYNESCAYPAAMESIRYLRTNFSPSLEWLKRYLDTPLPKRPALYPMAVSFLRESRTETVPTPIAMEWIRSPLFLSGQRSINSSFREQEKANDWLPGGEDEPTLPEAERKRLSAGAAYFRKTGAAHALSQSKRRAQERGRIEAELQRLTVRMQRQLQGILDTTNLIEVDVLQGAAADVVARHHGRKGTPPRFASSSNRAMLDWGEIFPGPAAELWRDEARWVVSIDDGCISSLSGEQHGTIEK